MTYSKVTRLEIIDHTYCDGCKGRGRITVEGVKGDFECPSCHGTKVTGREVVFHNPNKAIRAELQDDGRTLKIFVETRKL